MTSFSTKSDSYTANLNNGSTWTGTANNLDDAIRKAAQAGHVRAIDTTDRMNRR